ncbi:MAG: methyl-accepting chemotaxis protein [bacterium]|jgi:methyl-accepting chemotaxis protein
MKLKTRYQFYFLLSAIIPLVLVSSYYIINNSITTKTGIKNELQSIARIKQETLKEYLLNTAKNMTSISKNEKLQEMLHTYYKSSLSHIKKTDPYAVTYNLLLNQQEVFWGTTHHMFIADRSGKVILSPLHKKEKHTHEGQNISNSKLFKKALKKGVITDFFGFEEADHYHQLYMQPIFDRNGEILGILVVEVMIEYELNLLKKRFQLGKTGEIFMTALDGTRIEHHKSKRKAPLKQKGIFQAIEEGHVVTRFQNEQKKDILGIYLHEKGLPWVLSVQVEESEVFSKVNQQIIHSLIFVVLVLLSIFLISGFVVNRLVTPLKKLTHALQNIAEGEGDLRKRLEVYSNDEIGELSHWFNVFTESIQNLVKELGVNAVTLAAASNEFSATITQFQSSTSDIAHGTEQENAALTESSTAINEMASSVQAITRRMQEIEILATSAEKDATYSQGIVIQANQSMGRIKESSKKIEGIMNVIMEISNQTNLLSLNAAIEAAKAGEHGKGFAVVADEVRTLAEKSNDSSETIRNLIETSSENVHAGSEIIQETNQTLNQVIDKVQNITLQITEVTDSIKEQNNGTQELSQALDEIASISENNSCSAQLLADRNNDLVSTATEISEMSDTLQSRFEGFKV